MANVYLYAVSYDLGFAPNPFGGLCSLACCKPDIRKVAEIGDWVVGLTGTRLKPSLRCVFAMVVTRAISFDDYWLDPEFKGRRPRRNLSFRTQVGDNIYHRSNEQSPWAQEDSVHSLEDGSKCEKNTAHDTRINRILLSERFIYFGMSAPSMPPGLLRRLSYFKNPRNFQKFDWARAKPLTDWLEPKIRKNGNMLLGDPIDFGSTGLRYSADKNRLV